MTKPVLAADLGGTKLSMGLIRADGLLLVRRTEAVEISSRFAPIAQMVRLARDLAGDTLSRNVAAAGVCVPGLVRPSGTVWAPNLPGWQRVPLAQILERELGVPVLVESDRNAAVFGEVWMGKARGCQDVIVLMVGTGIGAGILSGGRLVRGAHELSGCAGWMVLTEADSPEIRRCGDLEATVAGPAIAAAFQKARSAQAADSSNSGKTLTAEQVAEAARKGDPVAREIFAHVGCALGAAVANLVSLFDPEVIVLTGGLGNAADLYLKAVKQIVRERAQPQSARQVRICVSRLDALANILGVAALTLQTLAQEKAGSGNARVLRNSGNGRRRV